MTKKSMLGALSLLSFVALLGAAGCGGDSSDNNKGSATGLGVVSCDITQAGLHYCEEAPGNAGTDTGCPMNMAGFVPGTSCTRTGVTGTCTTGNYKFFLYTAGAAASAVASICPAGTYQPVSGSGDIGSDPNPTTPVSTAGACATLQACCNSATIEALKTSCLQVYSSAVSSGDQTCAGYLPIYQLALSCK